MREAVALSILAVLLGIPTRRCRRFFRLFTELEIDTIEQLQRGEINEAKRVWQPRRRRCATAGSPPSGRPRRHARSRGKGRRLAREVLVSGSELHRLWCRAICSRAVIPAFELFSRAGLAAFQW